MKKNQNSKVNIFRRQKFHKFWLKITAIVIAIAAPAFFFGSMLETSEPARFSLDIISWPIDRLQNFDAPTTRFLSALTGGFLLGWGTLIWCLSSMVYDKSPNLVRKTVVISICSWFILDSCGSIASGNWQNAVTNILVLLIAVGPLWLKAKDENEK